MASQSDKSKKTSVDLIPFRWSHVKRPVAFSVPPVPEAFYQPIGAVTVFWGFLEPEFNKLINALLMESGQTEPRWQQMNFRKRRKLLRKLIMNVFAEHPAMMKALLALLTRAANIHWRRNLLVHGRYAYLFPGKGGPGKFNVTGKVNGRQITLYFSPDDLEKMWHEIAMISGELSRLSDPSNRHEPVSSHDRSLLREILRRHPSHTTDPTAPRPPQSSEA